MIEILAPAGNEECAYASLNAGANAIYLGLSQFSARDSAENFTVEALVRVCTYAHLIGAKVYVCLNTLVKDDETESFFESARAAYNAGADALLVQDLFLGKRLKELYPEITLHLSTQGGCCNEYGALLAKEYGFSRVVLARETPLSEIKTISRIVETEAFVQGALCSSFSGQCYFSSFAGNNSGNRGRCKQPCRKLYSIDRQGYEEPAYALSLSDLSLGKSVGEYLAAGVSSLKIEGRMRRPEYAAAAVGYYRALLAGKNTEEELSLLKRAFNRGDYTKGLAFGQDGTLLSRNVQGHVGEEVGFVQLTKRGYFCKSAFKPQKGDGFKILRAGREVGGAALSENAEGGFYLSSAQRLQEGDAVRVTTSKEACGRALSGKVRRKLSLRLTFLAGGLPRAEGEGVLLLGDTPLERARSAPLTKEELSDCFLKIDSLPFAPGIEVATDGVFLPKSVLNGFRRSFYEKLVSSLAPLPSPLERRQPGEPVLSRGEGTLRAVLCTDGGADADVVIVKPADYANIPERGGERERYLYLPPLFTAEDEALVAPALKEFDGVYCEGYYGVLLARKYGVSLFAGTGLNLTNRYAVGEAIKLAKYVALSKEISYFEQRKLVSPAVFCLTGEVKLMDLAYCPFSKTCSSCDKRQEYALTDEEGRKFPLRRYRLAGGGCRFEVYNCARLSEEYEGCNTLLDCSVQQGGRERTRGHFVRSML